MKPQMALKPMVFALAALMAAAAQANGCGRCAHLGGALHLAHHCGRDGDCSGGVVLVVAVFIARKS